MISETPARSKGLTLALSIARCDACTLDCTEAVESAGSKLSTIAVVGEAPYAGYSTPLDGKPLALLNRAFVAAGQDRTDVYYTNALLCPTPFGKPVKAKNVDACRERLFAELAGLPNLEVVICLGASAALALRGQKAPLTQLNGRIEWSDELSCQVVYSYHPNAVLRNPDLYRDFLWAIRQGVHAKTLPAGPKPKEEIWWTVPNSVEEALDELAALWKYPLLACDLETTGLLPVRDKILSWGVAYSPTECLIIPAKLLHHASVRDALQRLHESSKIRWIGHNFQFDCSFIRTNLGISARIDGDTMLLHHCLDERSGGDGGGHHDLKSLAQKYCGAPPYAESIDSANLANVDPEEMYEYQANDLCYTYRLWDVLTELAEEEAPSRMGYPSPRRLHDEFIVPATNAIMAIQLRGIRVDWRKLLDLIQEYSGLIETQRLALAKMVGAPDDFNPNSTKQVRAILETLGYPDIGSTAEAALHELQRMDDARGKPRHPFLDAVLEYRSTVHTKTTYLDGTAKRLAAQRFDDRIRGRIMLHGTTTGRLASRDPNLQNLPADSVVKSLFIASEGHTICNADYRRLEIGVLAYYSRDKKLMEDFMADDFHWNVAQSIFPGIIADMERSKESLSELERIARSHATFHDFAVRQSRPGERTDDPSELYGWLKTRLRRQAKYVSFGIAYGEGAVALAHPEKGLGVPVEDAAEFIRRWKATYAVAIAYLDEQVTYARKERWVESASGRRRRFDYPTTIATHIANEAMNHTIQAFASDINLAASVKLERLLPERGLGNVLMLVHDSILTELVTARLGEAVDLIREVMTTVVIDDEMVFGVDIATGNSWGECH